MTADLVIDRACAYALLQAALVERNDVLGFADFGGDPDGEEGEQVDFLAELADDAITGRQPGVLERLFRHPALGRMDPVTAALMESLGLVPAALFALDDALRPNTMLRIQDGDDREVMTATGSGSGSANWTIRLTDDPDGPMWDSLGTIIVGPMPESISNAAAGRPLRDMLTHPVLDDLPLAIRGMATVQTTGRAETRIHLEPVMADLGRDDLIRRHRAKQRKSAT